MMTLLWVLRAALYITFSLGVGRLLGLLTDRRLWDWHLGLGVAIVILALIALRPLPRVPASGLRQTARFFPLLPFAVGMALRFDLIGGAAVIIIHVALGIVTIGLIEAAAVRQRQALSGAP
jgi:hypothetical protein